MLRRRKNKRQHVVCLAAAAMKAMIDRLGNSCVCQQRLSLHATGCMELCGSLAGLVDYLARS